MRCKRGQIWQYGSTTDTVYGLNHPVGSRQLGVKLNRYKLPENIHQAMSQTTLFGYNHCAYEDWATTISK